MSTSGDAMHTSLTPEMAELLSSGVNDDLSTQGVAAMKTAAGDQSPQPRTQVGEEGFVVFPNGAKVKISDLQIDHTYVTGDHRSIFADTAKYLKRPMPDAMYVWAKKDDPNALAKVRAGMYRRVLLDELKDDCDLPISALEQTVISSTQRNAGKVVYVQMGDVQLMEVPPEAVKRLYKLPAAQAALKAAGNIPFDQLRDRVSQLTRGQAHVEFERKDVLSPM